MFSSIKLIKALEWFLGLTLLALAVLWSVDRFYYPLELGKFQVLINELRPLNSFEVLVLPFAFAFYKLSAKLKRLAHELESVVNGRLRTSVRCQTIMINPVKVGEKIMLALHWIQTIKVGPNQLSDYCGGSVGQEAYVRMMEEALKDLATPIPLINSRAARSALSEFEASHTAARTLPNTPTKPMVVIHASEDAGRIIQPRVFEFPPSMLLLFLNDEIHSMLVTTRDFHFERALALDSIAHQVIGATQFIPSMREFSPCYSFCVRNISVHDLGFDWWKEPWHIEIGNEYTPEELEQKRRLLLEALLQAKPVSKPHTYVVNLVPGFAAKLSSLKGLQATLPKAKML